jgi:membrane associated rhomboid family serine protease
VLPLRDRTPTTRTPWLTIGLIATNLVLFVLWQPTFGTEQDRTRFAYCEGLIPWEVAHASNLASGGAAARAAIDHDVGTGSGGPVQAALARACPAKNWWLPVGTSMFFHVGWVHLLGNLLFLWVFGVAVEDRLGPARGLLLYLGGGVVAAALQIAVAPDVTIPMLGASGAIGALLGAYLALFPRRRILTLVFVFAVVELPAVLVLVSWFVLQLFGGVGGIANDLDGGVAYWAHVGGFLAGLAAAWLLYARHDRGAATPARPDGLAG